MTGNTLHITGPQNGQAEFELAEPQWTTGARRWMAKSSRSRSSRKSIRAKHCRFNTSSPLTATYSIQAVEEHEAIRPPPRKPDEDDF